MSDLFSLADQEYEHGNYKEAFEIFLKIANSDNPDKDSAMDRIASMYDADEGVDYDFDKAIYWYKKAVDHGNHSTALHNLGVTYRAKGNIVEAKTWFEASLQAGNHNSALDLAKIYMVCENSKEKVIDYLKECLKGGDNLFEDVYLEATTLLAALDAET